MKKNLIYAGMLLLGMTVATGCSNEESLEQISNSGNIFEAVIENTVEGRTTVNDAYQVIWNADDAFSVWNVNEKVATLTLKSGEEGKTNGKFTIDNSEVSLTEEMVALFPASDAKSYNFAASFTSQETDAPMSATFANGKFTFKLLTAMVRVVATKVPKGDAVLTISSGNEVLTGIATLNNGALALPTNGGKEVIVTISNNTEGATLTFDLPVPTQDYTNGLNATLKVAGQEVFNKTTNSFTAEAGKLYKFEADASVVTNQTEFENALESGETIVLGDDITLGGTEALVIEQGTTATIDLNGNSLNLNGQLIQVGEGAILSLVNNTTSGISRNASEGVTISSTSDIIKAAANSVINIGEGVNLVTTGAGMSCIWIPNGANGVTVNSAGNLKCTTAGGAVISHNGYLTSGVVNITGGSVIHEKDVAIYIAGVAELNVSGKAVVEGTNAVEIRAGKLNITGSPVFTSTATTFSEAANGNGTTIVGAAVAVSQHTTEKPIEVTISGTPTFESNFYALYEKELHEDPTDVTMSVTGGTFNGKVYSENCAAFITGGTFADPSACYYLGTNADVDINMTEDYTGPGFKTQSGQAVSLEIAAGKTYTVTAPLVGSAGTQTLGFQFLKGSTITIGGNGTITSSEAKMLINNYSNLTLSGVTLAPSIPNTMNGQTYYVLSNNCGEVNIEEGTIITAPTSSNATNCPTVYAFDVCKYASYPNVTVNVNGGTITGNVEYTGKEGDKQKLIISGGTITGDLVVADTYKNASWTGVSIIGGTQNGNGWDAYKPIDSAKLIGIWNNVHTLEIKEDGTFNQYFNKGDELLNEKWTLIGRILKLTQVGDNDDPEYIYIVSLTDTFLEYEEVTMDGSGNLEVDFDEEVHRYERLNSLS